MPTPNGINPHNFFTEADDSLSEIQRDVQRERGSASEEEKTGAHMARAADAHQQGRRLELEQYESEYFHHLRLQNPHVNQDPTQGDARQRVTVNPDLHVGPPGQNGENIGPLVDFAYEQLFRSMGYAPNTKWIAVLSYRFTQMKADDLTEAVLDRLLNPEIPVMNFHTGKALHGDKFEFFLKEMCELGGGLQVISDNGMVYDFNQVKTARAGLVSPDDTRADVVDNSARFTQKSAQRYFVKPSPQMQFQMLGTLLLAAASASPQRQDLIAKLQSRMDRVIAQLKEIAANAPTNLQEERNQMFAYHIINEFLAAANSKGLDNPIMNDLQSLQAVLQNRDHIKEAVPTRVEREDAGQLKLWEANPTTKAEIRQKAEDMVGKHRARMNNADPLSQSDELDKQTHLEEGNKNHLFFRFGNSKFLSPTTTNVSEKQLKQAIVNNFFFGYSENLLNLYATSSKSRLSAAVDLITSQNAISKFFAKLANRVDTSLENALTSNSARREKLFMPGHVTNTETTRMAIEQINDGSAFSTRESARNFLIAYSYYPDRNQAEAMQKFFLNHFVELNDNYFIMLNGVPDNKLKTEVHQGMQRLIKDIAQPKNFNKLSAEDQRKFLQAVNRLMDIGALKVGKNADLIAVVKMLKTQQATTASVSSSSATAAASPPPAAPPQAAAPPPPPPRPTAGPALPPNTPHSAAAVAKPTPPPRPARPPQPTGAPALPPKSPHSANAGSKPTPPPRPPRANPSPDQAATGTPTPKKSEYGQLPVKKDSKDQPTINYDALSSDGAPTAPATPSAATGASSKTHDNPSPPASAPANRNSQYQALPASKAGSTSAQLLQALSQSTSQSSNYGILPLKASVPSPTSSKHATPSAPLPPPLTANATTADLDGMLNKLQKMLNMFLTTEPSHKLLAQERGKLLAEQVQQIVKLLAITVSEKKPLPDLDLSKFSKDQLFALQQIVMKEMKKPSQNNNGERQALLALSAKVALEKDKLISSPPPAPRRP